MKRGFTLAEVLITLSIIGIISALTLPGLRSGMGDRKANAWYAKYCNILDGAVKQAMFDNNVGNAELLSAPQVGAQLQAVDSGNGLFTMKDGTVVNLAHFPVANVAFPQNAKVDNRFYAASNVFDGINCVNNGGATADAAAGTH